MYSSVGQKNRTGRDKISHDLHSVPEICMAERLHVMMRWACIIGLFSAPLQSNPVILILEIVIQVLKYEFLASVEKHGVLTLERN